MNYVTENSHYHNIHQNKQNNCISILLRKIKIKFNANNLANQAHKWQVEAFNREPGRPLQIWRSTVANDQRELKHCWAVLLNPQEFSFQKNWG